MRKNKFKQNIITLIIALVILIPIMVVLSNLNNCSNGLCSVTGNSVTNGDVVAKVNGEPITADELNTDYKILSFLNKDPSTQLSMATVLNQTIIERLLYNKALNQGYAADSIDDDLTKVLAISGLTINEFRKQLASENITYDSFINFYKKQKVINEFFNKTIFNHLLVNEKDLSDFYNNNINQFIQPEQVRVTYLLFNTTNDAIEAIDQIKNGANITELAINLSIPNNGDLGYFSRGQMIKELENTAFNLTIGDYSREPINTSYGYFVIMLTDHKDEKVMSLKEVTPSLTNYLLSLKKQEAVNYYISNLLNKTNIKILLNNSVT